MQTYRTMTKTGVMFVLAVIAVTGCAAPLLPGAGTPEPVQIVQVERAAAIVETAPVPADAPQPAGAPTSDAKIVYTFDDVELAPARLCPPNNPQYSRLSRDDFWDGKIDQDATGAYAWIKYKNEDGQRFDILVRGSNSEEGMQRIAEYVNEARVCLEAVENRSMEVTEFEPIEVAQSSLDPQELAVVNGAIALARSNNWWDLPTHLSPTSLLINVFMAGPEIDPNSPEPFSAQLGRLRFDLQARIAKPEEVKAVVTFAKKSFSRFDEVARRQEMKDEEFALWFFEEFWPALRLTTHFVMDPTIHPISTGEVHIYRTWCAQAQERASAKVSLNSKLNIVKISLIESDGDPKDDIGPLEAKQGSRSLSLSLSRKASGIFNSIVTGGEREGKYTISEGWVLEGSCLW